MDATACPGEKRGLPVLRNQVVRLAPTSALVLAALIVTLLPTRVAQAQPTIPVNIESTPAGATVYLDSPEGQNLGVTPLRRVRITRGNHTLVFRLPRHRDASVAVNVIRRNETFRGVLDPLGELTITAANDSASGANVRIDGQLVGTLPVNQMVDPGRHLIQIDREGYVTFTQWVQVAGAQQLALPVLLERQAPSTGSVLVASDISGAAIYVDGEPRGSTPTVIDNVTAGIHQIEVRSEGFQTQAQTVEIRAGERARVEVQLRPDVPPGGTLVVVTQPRGASVVLDGEALGAGPVTRENVSPGEHILEVSMTGFQPITQPVTIEAGQRRAVNIVLQEVVLAPGSIIVRSSAPGAVVVVDGEERGAPPVVVESATAGTHAIVVRAPGFQEYRTTCAVGPGRNCEVDAELGAEPVRVIVRSNVPNSALYLDGTQVGPVPYEGTVPSGNRRLEVRAPGYDPYIAQVMLAPAAEPRVFDVALLEEGAMTDEERARLERERLENYAGQTSFAANVIPTSQALIDLSVMYPSFFELRAGTGFADWIDGGISIRGNHRLFEFEARARVAWRVTPQIGLGAQVFLGGGIGPDSANSFHTGLEGLASILFAKRAAVTLWVGFDFYRDRFERGDEVTMIVRGRSDNTGMVRIGGSFELRLTSYWNLFTTFEGNLLSDRREIYDGLFRTVNDSGTQGNNTSAFSGRFGFTYKFH